MDLSGKDVLVVGTKRSGQGAIALLRAQGASVRAMDQQLPSTEEQTALGVPVALQADENIGNPDLIVLSPAVPWDEPMFAAARARGVKVIGEVELASYFLNGPVIGITGSNGKTTTTALTGHLLKECGVAVQVGGNIGTAVTTLVASSRPEQWNVLELSSFQLESIERFRADIAACLNITPDHLDRHHTMESYAAAKRRLFETQSADGKAVLNWRDPVCRTFVGSGQAYWFSSSEPVPRGMWLSGDGVLFEGERFMQRSEIKLRGVHNVENVMAAALMAHLAGAQLDGIAKAVATFPGVEHRIEFVRELRGVQYYNDSKATNVDATLKAIDSFDEKLWIILGGKDKGGSYEPLVEALQRTARAALLIGAAAPLIRQTLDGRVPYVECGVLREAIEYAHAHAVPGDVVLLAPACASFDQFTSYEHRGRTFKQIVGALG